MNVLYLLAGAEFGGNHTALILNEAIPMYHQMKVNLLEFKLVCLKCGKNIDLY